MQPVWLSTLVLSWKWRENTCTLCHWHAFPAEKRWTARFSLMVYQAHLKTRFEILLTPWTQRTGEIPVSSTWWGHHNRHEILSGTKVHWLHNKAHCLSFPKVPTFRDEAHVTSKAFSLILEGWPEEDQRESTGCLGFLSAPTVSKVKVANIRRKFTVTQHMTSGDRQPRRYAWTHREGDRLPFGCAS